ncbi:hypothetical protein SAMN05428966_11870 [Massilia sp. PDC64]|nr:hypothetical protein [Massilia sp. PDC64]SDF64141.1 hypothetical protein SAMN05428966_11870 [Massilia sp. PDC64]
MSGHRQAAVALHALTEADRALVLAELPEDDRQILRGYLAELDELGFATTEAAELLPRAAHAHADALADARAADVHLLLQGEPAALVAQVLSIAPWRWRNDYLALQSGARREQMRAAAPDGPVAPARAAFLADALRARLGQLPAAAPAAQDGATHAGRRRPAWLRLVTMPWTR